MIVLLLAIKYSIPAAYVLFDPQSNMRTIYVIYGFCIVYSLFASKKKELIGNFWNGIVWPLGLELWIWADILREIVGVVCIQFYVHIARK